MSRRDTPRRLTDASGPETVVGRLLARSLEEEAREDTSIARRRVWRGIAGRLDGAGRPRWRAPVLVAAASALAVLVAGLAVQTWVGARPSDGPPVAHLELAAGDVTTAPSEGSWGPAQAGHQVGPATRVKTGARAVAVVRLPRSAVALSSTSEVAFDALGESTLLRLHEGRMTAEVAPRRGGQSFVVQTGAYRVTVKGTVFSVEERGPGDVQVSVSRGQVEVTGPQGTWQVPAGRAWRSRQPRESVPAEASGPAEALLSLAMREGPRAAVRVEGPETLEALEVSEDGLRLGPAPLTWLAPEGHHLLVGASDGGVRAVEVEAAGGVDGAVTTARFAPAPVAEPASAPSAPAPLALREEPASRDRRRPPSRSPRRRDPQAGEAEPASELSPFEAAVQLDAHGRSEEAARAFASIADGGGPRADLALYELGRIQHLRLKHPGEALVTFERYQRAYPRGTMIQEVEISGIEIQLQRRDFDAALASMRRFLARHPSSERTGEIYVLRGNVERERGDCEAALGDYHRAREGAQADDALYFTGWCQQHLGENEPARETWRAYLARFPTGRHVAEARTALGEPPVRSGGQ